MFSIQSISICLLLCICMTTSRAARFALSDNQLDGTSRRKHDHVIPHTHSHSHSQSNDQPNERHPRVGAFLKDFKGSSIKDLSTNFTTDIILPYLAVEDYAWEGFLLQLQCNFTEPVQWIYSGDGAPLVETETYRITPDINNPSTYIYGANVIFTHTDFKQTGRYICQTISQPQSHHSDLHVFVTGKRIFVSDNENDEIVIHGDAFNRWIRLPCAVSNPNASVQLFKDGQELALSRKKVYFDPKVGFELSRDDLTNPWDRYDCVEKNTGQRLSIRVEPPKYILGELMHPESVKAVYSENPFVEDETTRAMTHLKFHYDKRQKLVMCCAFDMHGQHVRRYPALKSASCSSLNECQMIKKHLDQNKCSKREVCEGTKLKRHCVGYELTDFDDEGIIECSLKSHHESKEYFQFSKVGETVITDFDVIPPTDNILKIIAEDSSTPGQKLLTCQANSFFFSRGIIWAFQKDNNELTFLNQDYPAKITVEVNPTEISSVHCFAPIWKSTDWRNISISYPYN